MADQIEENKDKPVQGAERIGDKDPRLQNMEDVVKAARAKISRKYNEKQIQLGGEMSRSNMAEVVVRDMVLTHPIDKIKGEWKAELEKGEDPQKLNEKYRPLIDEAVKTAEAYLEKMTHESGWITAEVLVRMTSDINRSAHIYADLFASGENHDLLEVFQAYIGMTGKNSDLAEAKAKGTPILKKYMASEFPKGDKGLMACVWMTMSFMNSEERVSIAKDYLNGKQASEAEVDEFLRKGNFRGVFTPEEMEEVSGQKFQQEEERAELAKVWKAQNDFSAQAKEIILTPYGSENMAGKWISGGGILMLYGQLLAGATIGGNVLVGIWKGNALKSPAGIIKATVGNPYNLGAAAALVGIDQYKKGKGLGQLLEGKEDRDSHKHRESIAALKGEIGGNPLWPSLDSFFRKDKFSGAKAFYDYVLAQKKLNKNELPEDKDIFTASNFSEHLKLMAARKGRGEKMDTNIDYAALEKTFGDVKSTELLEMARIFDNLNIGRENAKDNYEAAIKETKTA